MNIEKVFDFIKEKRGYNIPFVYKLIKGLPLTEDDLNVEGDLNLYGINIPSLPNNLKVGGDLGLVKTNITSLPNNLTVGGSLSLVNTNIKSLPDNLKVGGDLDLFNTPLSKKYSRVEIIKMIKEKDLYIGKDIWI